MASLLNKASTFSRFRSSNSRLEGQFVRSSRGFHIEPGPREKALLEDHPALTRFRPDKERIEGLIRLQRIATFVVIAGCCYMVYINAIMRFDAPKQVQKRKEGQREGAILQENRT